MRAASPFARGYFDQRKYLPPQSPAVRRVASLPLGRRAYTWAPPSELSVPEPSTAFEHLPCRLRSKASALASSASLVPRARCVTFRPIQDRRAEHLRLHVGVPRT